MKHSSLIKAKDHACREGVRLHTIRANFTRRDSAALAGYTILEMCMVLFIIALIAGAAIPATSGMMAENALREPLLQIELMARTARHLAITQQRPYILVINHDHIRLVTQEQYQLELDSASTAASSVTAAPATATANSPATTASDSNSDDSTPDPSMDPVEQNYDIDKGLVLTVRGWQEKDLSNPEDRLWIFPPTGLSEPLQIHLQKGDGYIEQTYDPLTTAVKTETVYLP